MCSSANIIKWVFLGTGSFSSILEFLLQAYFGRKNYLLLFSIPPPPLLIPSYSVSALPSGNAVQNQVLDKVSLSSCLYVTMWLLQIQSLSQKFGLVSVRLSSHLASSSFFKPLDSGSSQEQFYLASLYA